MFIVFSEAASRTPATGPFESSFLTANIRHQTAARAVGTSAT
jgi:hypothetical protein